MYNAMYNTEIRGLNGHMPVFLLLGNFQSLLVRPATMSAIGASLLTS